MDFILERKSKLYRQILSYTMSYLCTVSETQKHPPVRREDLWVQRLHHLPDNSQDENSFFCFMKMMIDIRQIINKEKINKDQEDVRQHT